MSSLPNEVLEHVLHPLDRWTLDAAQFTNRRFLQLIMKRMSDLYLRKIEFANFTVTNASSVGVAEYAVRIDGRPVRRDSAAYYIADLFSEFLHLLRGSSVAYLYLWGLVLTPELLARVTQAPIVAGTLSITSPGFDVAGSCAELSPSQFHELLLHFSPTSLDFGGCRLRAC
ncbi:hypothetical protein AAVH_18533 [Aphelenchoides avenae]|nr:hypothetical protein AAVH_18533 [Aphelenchus avenae]